VVHIITTGFQLLDSLGLKTENKVSGTKIAESCLYPHISLNIRTINFVYIQGGSNMTGTDCV
jgi:hypothetical protein